MEAIIKQPVLQQILIGMQVRMAAGATFCTIFRRSGLYQPLETVQSLSALCGSALRKLKLFQTMAQFAQGGSGQADS